jgi:hypothetical protein
MPPPRRARRNPANPPANPAPQPNPLVAAIAQLGAGPVSALLGGGTLTGPQQTALGAALQNLPELVTFSGLSAGTLPDPSDPTGPAWPALFLNAQMSKWLLVEPGGLFHHETFQDPISPGQTRDVFWVRADATIRWGSETRSGPGRFLRGQFTSAGDYSASVSGGTVNPATGIFCQVPTPGCCGYRSHN